ncbi:rod shape-determining protein MreD [Bacteroidota bacterium]
MITILINNSLRFIFLVLFQVLVLNNIQFSGMVNPYLYVLFILLLPFETPGWILLLSSFLLGFLIDVFPQGITGNYLTTGMHTSAAVFMAFLRPLVLKLISPTEGYDKGTQPTLKDYGLSWFLKYSVFLIIPHHMLLFILEEASLTHFFIIILRVIISLIFTVILVLISQYLRYRKT